jgi:glycerol-3-phosphate dehydrogenase
MSPAAIAESMGEQVAEGVHSAVAAMALAAENGVELPITREVLRLLEGGCPRTAVDALMGRDLKAE